ncbi:MAG: hypothetical protein ACP5OA_03250 [Candidatus Woesearchaeota archaeon]
MREFKEFLRLGAVKKQKAEINRSRSLVEESIKKKEFLELTIKTIPKDKWNPNVISEQCYDILMELIRAKMFIDGYNSNSHEAEVAYMKIIGFSEADVKYMDELRYYRNGTKYYGTALNLEYAEKTVEFLNKTYPKLLKIVR